ncbi:MAG TPA: hypothetical protein VHF69_11505, partial [Candidatus Synoicihabitans sp.]|nr:hypothetical protein [Candidatus Synoicihabitans sp.]
RHVPLVFPGDCDIPSTGDNVAPIFSLTDGLSVVFKQIAIPDENTDWVKILDIRDDPEVTSAFLDLRSWLRGAVDSCTDTHDLPEILREMLNKYERSLSVHRARTRYSVLEAVLNGTVGLAENLLKLKLTEAAKAVLGFRLAQIENFENETELEGREVRYILNIRDKLERR